MSVVTSSSFEGPNFKHLENDNCPFTMDREDNFFKDFTNQYEPYQSVSLNSNQTIINSRTKGCSFKWTGSLTIDNLKEYFSKTGHTLGIDYTRTYVRKFALDIDCFQCRSPSLSHTNDNNNFDGFTRLSSSRSTMEVAAAITTPPPPPSVSSIRTEAAATIATSSILNENSITDISIDTNIPDLYSELDYDNLHFNNEEQIYKICEYLENLFKNDMGVCEKIIISTWKNKCGFHIYTNVNVSLPTHLHLWKILESRHLTMNCKIEIPTIMPLPFSAKRSFVLYKSTSDNISLLNSENRSFDLIVRPLEKYYELFDYEYCTSYDFSPSTNCCLEMSTLLNRVLIKLGMIRSTSDVRTCRDILEIKLYNPNMEQLRTFYTTISHDCKTFDESAINKTSDCVSLQPSMVITGASAVESFINSSEDNGNSSSDSPNAVIITEHHLSKLSEFFVNFNEIFANERSSSSERFVQLSSVQYGGMYLQAFVVMLDKRLKFQNTKVFKKILKEHVYVSRIETDEPLKRFIRFYDETLRETYVETSDCMLDVLRKIYIYDLQPRFTINEKLKECMQKSLNCTAEECSNFIREADKNNKMLKFRQVMSKYFEFLQDFKILYFCNNTNHWYILNDFGYYSFYNHSNFQSFLPGDIHSWFGLPQMVRSISDEIKCQTHVFKKPSNLWTTNRFMMCTPMGVFNSISGLYTAHTPFLRFDKFIPRALWPLDRLFPTSDKEDKHNYDSLNADLLEYKKKVYKFFDIIENKICTIFTHFILAPALIQLHKILFIQESYISKIIHLLLLYPNLEDAYFLVDYFPIDIKFVYIIMTILSTNEIRCFDTYKKLCETICATYSRVNAEIWQNQFARELQSFQYTPNNSSYMQEVKSIRGLHISNVTENFAFIAVVLSVCLMKCPSYDQFVYAFGLTNQLPQPRNTHPLYDMNFTYETTLAEHKKNLDRTKKILFRNAELTEDENILFNTVVSLCMGPYFCPVTTNELINMLATSLVGYNERKKVQIFYGEQGTGKSYICDILQHIFSTSCGRFPGLSEAQKRSTIASKVKIIILNEFKKINTNDIKAVSGNDGESASIFFCQSYELKSNQALLFAATNDHPKLANNEEMDHVTARRFHAIRLLGEQWPSTSPMISLIEMMSMNRLYKNTIEISMDAISMSVLWLCYIAYESRRDMNYMPYLNENCECVIEYSNLAYYINNPLYHFLVNSGFRQMEGFHISTNLFLKQIQAYMNAANNDTSARKIHKDICDMASFKIQFRRQYAVDLNTVHAVQNFQTIEFINHVICNMETVPYPGNIITRQNIEDRINAIYDTAISRDNARSYFTRNNIEHFNKSELYYKNIVFRSQYESPCNTVDFNNDLVGATTTDNFSSNCDAIGMIPHMTDIMHDDVMDFDQNKNYEVDNTCNLAVTMI